MAHSEAMSSCERLESPENLRFQQRSWRVEAFGRAMITLLVLAAMAGLLGGGPLSQGKAATADGSLQVEYPRIARADSTYRITLQVASSALVGGKAELWIDSTLLEALEVEAVSPEPEGQELDRGRLVYRFVAATDADPAPIVLHVKTDNAGRHAGQIGVRDGTAVTLSLWIHP